MKQVPIYTKRLYIYGLFYFKFRYQQMYKPRKFPTRPLWCMSIAILKCYKGIGRTHLYSPTLSISLITLNFIFGMKICAK